MSTFRDYVTDVAEKTHAYVLFYYNAEESTEEATLFSADETSIVLLSDREPWGDLLQEFESHVLH